MAKLNKLLSRLAKAYGEPEPPPAHGPFELVMWENACYLLPDERRAMVFQLLRERVGMSAAAIAAASDELLLPLATLGGMRPEVRVFRWREIARITLTQFDGDVDQILERPVSDAKRALKGFPNIGDPGAEKVLMFCGMEVGLPLESNGLRVLTRVGYGREQKDYGRMYRSAQEALSGEIPRDAKTCARSFVLLREHGKAMCKAAAPLCLQCPIVDLCGYPTKNMLEADQLKAIRNVRKIDGGGAGRAPGRSSRTRPR
jgi:endonuclease-3